MTLATCWHFLEDFDAVGDCSNDEIKTFDCAARFAGEADDEGFVHHNCEIAGEDRVFRDLHGFAAHHFAEAGEFAHSNFPDSFGCDVAEGDASAAGREDEVAAFSNVLADGALNGALFVGDERFSEDFPAVGLGGFFEGGTAEVVVEAPRGAVADCDNSNNNLHGAVFSY